METLGSRIRSLRKDKKLTQANVAKHVGVSPVAVTQWEQNTNIPKGQNLLTLAGVFRCDPHWLLYGDDPNSLVPRLPEPSPEELEEFYLQNKPKIKFDNIVTLEYFEIEENEGFSDIVIKDEKCNRITFIKEFIEEVIGVDAFNIFLMGIRGDSMAPTLKDQAIVMVKRINQFSDDGVYLFQYHNELFVKRLQRTKGGLTVISDNKSYKEWELTRLEISSEDFHIVGKIVWSSQVM